VNLIFSKYQGTGNDFVLVDNREGFFPKENKQIISKICDRRYGVGADGLILLEKSSISDFKMIYFNSDGNEGSMCGNGGRCIVAFAHHLELIADKTKFIAIDGEHEAKIEERDDKIIVSLKMSDVNEIEEQNDGYALNSGSPHFVKFIETHDNFDTATEGHKLRHSIKYKEDSVNVNFVSIKEDTLTVSTFERGVEDETHSCGTGVTAAAICASKKLNKDKFKIETKGGTLEVCFNQTDSSYNNIWLKAEAEKVFVGATII
jgi:diaminopimelate epimerase